MKENVYVHNQHQPYWKRVYNSLAIWIFLYLMLIAVGFYIIAVDFSFEPHQQMKPQSKNLGKSLTNPINESLKVNK